MSVAPSVRVDRRAPGGGADAGAAGGAPQHRGGLPRSVALNPAASGKSRFGARKGGGKRGGGTLRGGDPRTAVEKSLLKGVLGGVRTFFNRSGSPYEEDTECQEP